jgi:hypothetical protein
MQECRTNSFFVALSQCRVPGNCITAKVTFQEPPIAPGASLLDATVWLDGARPANTCIPSSFPWIRHQITAHQYPPRWLRWLNRHLINNLLASFGGQKLEPDSTEGGRDTGAGMSNICNICEEGQSANTYNVALQALLGNVRLA